MQWTRIDRSAVLFTIVVVTLIGVAGCVEQVLPPSDHEPSPTASGSIFVEANVAEARVFLDTAYVGSVSDGLLIEGVVAGDHSVTVAAAGYAPATIHVSVEERSHEEVKIALMRLSAQSPSDLLTGRVVDGTVLTNGGFESGSSDWSRTGPVSLVSDAAEGALSMRADKSHPGGFQKIDLVPGQSYTLTASIKTDRVNGFGAWVSYVMTSSTDGSARTWSTPILDGSQGWTSVSHTFTVPDTFDRGQVELGLELGRGSAWFDAISLVPTSLPEPEPAVCGDGVAEGAEECDTGSSNGGSCDAAYGEVCTYCSDSCTVSSVDGGSCGDGTCQVEEDSSTCSADCGAATYCGDGVIQSPNDDGVSEECDRGSSNTDLSCVAGYDEWCEYCTTSCSLEVVDGGSCGDGTCQVEEDPSACSADCGSSGPAVLEIGTGSGLTVVADDAASEGSSAYVSSLDSHDTGIFADGSVYVRMYGPSGSEDAVVLTAGKTSDRIFPSQWASYEWVEAEVSNGTISIEGVETNVRLDVLVVSDSPLNGTELDALVSVETTVPEPTPVQTVNEYSLRGDPSFEVSQLSTEQRLWYDRLWHAIDSGTTISLASRDDTYEYGRPLNLDMTTLLLAFRTTGDLELLDAMDDVMQTMRAELRDGWCAPSEPRRENPSGDNDGYVAWVWRHSDDTIYTCRDEHEMDEMMTHGWIAEMAYTYHANRDLSSPSGVDYAERADFWHDYLKNHFEAKWRERTGRTSGYPFLDRPLTHPVLNFARYHWYMHRITGEQGYLDEATRLAAAYETSATAIEPTPEGEAYVWCHIVPSLSKCYSVQPSNYARYTLASIHDLMIDGFEPFDTADRDRYTRTISHFLIDDETMGTQTFAPDVYGGGTHEWMPRSGDAEAGERLIPGQFTSNFVYAPYDTTGEIVEFAELTLDWTDSVSAPRNVEIPAAMVYYHSFE